MIRVLYGLRNGTLVSAQDADRGAACHCTCPGCGGALIARKGPSKRPHFAHAAGGETRGCGETALHHAAKSLLAAPGGL
jgi:competence protein CoiA